MPCLKALSSPSRRDTSYIACDPRPDHEQQRDFDALLNPATPGSVPSTPPALEAAWPRHPRSALAQAFAPDIAQLRGLGRRHPGTLDLRLTNGPLAGLEIRASAQASLLYLNIKVADRDTFERIVGTRGLLENQLAEIFNRPVALTLQQLNGEPW
ncbi:hypothetical protein C4K04_4348 [Pseudomonas chlororaphis]|uniref:Type III secretion protein n=1 Tax=Pseudomonas chlororaphis TaxID=587753 RepID=A0A3G7TUE2_9PSED|nr:hypothetical protein [Pseudomonas chlororaphis]AZE50012.1 hypothetical protein C4K04_4348 [Pseudomonas chlororaphis]